MFKDEFKSASVSRLEEVECDILTKKSIRLLLKRDDKILSFVSGNKFRKLKHNVEALEKSGIKRILTFGGVFSNHIHAAAAMGNALGIETIGVIRGEERHPLSSTLQFAASQGMRLHFVSRADYRDKENLLDALRATYGDFFLLPEGGSNALGVLGCAEISKEINAEMTTPPDYLCVACGTGATLAGMITGASAGQKLIGFSALKGDFLTQEVSKWLPSDVVLPDWRVTDAYSFGGYAKWQPELIAFMNRFYERHGVLLDPVYTGKMLFGILDLVSRDYFPPHSTIVAVHTGGLQGIEGFNAYKLKNTGWKIKTGVSV